MEDDEEGNFGYRIRRLRDAALRGKWIASLIVLAGAVAGFGATKLVNPRYDVETKLYLGAQRSDNPRQGPIQEGQFVGREGLVELLRSYRVLEPVVLHQRMHVWVEDSLVGRAAFQRLDVGPDLQGGSYRLEVLPGGTTYTLHRKGTPKPVGQGSFPDSVGRSVGILWRVERGELPVGSHQFEVLPPRDAAQILSKRIRTSLPLGGQILTLSLSDINAKRAAQTLNAVVDEFLAVARELQRTQTGEYAVALRAQLELAEARLRGSEQALQSVRAANITQPTQGDNGAVDPLVTDYFSKRVALENLRRDRRSLEQLLQTGSGITVEGLLAIPSVAQSNAALNDALLDLGRKESQLREARKQFSDEYVTVRDLVSQVSTLRRETIPRLAASKLEEMKLTERDLDQTVNAFSGELRKTPQRRIDEIRVKRDFDIADQYYTSLLSRWNEVRLASEGSTAELKVIDRALPLATASSNSKRVVFAGGLFAGLILAILFVVVSDLLDGRIRYPEEVERDLRLRLITRVPMLPTRVKRDAEILVAAQAVEAFRAIRLSLEQEFQGRGCITVVVTSEGVNEGKSLISANLATSFADCGMRTLLVDGDLRRGGQHRSYGIALSPGFADVLGGKIAWRESVSQTTTASLSVLPAGTRSQRVPELLDRERLTRLIDEFRNSFDVVIIDSAPLGAGVDTYALSVAAGSMLMILRYGTTPRKAADGRLTAVDQLPVRVIGAVLNGVPTTKSFGMYDAYAYLDDYALVGEGAPQPMLPRRDS